MYGKIELHGKQYWLLESGAIAPLEHIDSEGHIKDLETALLGLGHAYLFENGDIYRHGKKIGTKEDIKFI